MGVEFRLRFELGQVTNWASKYNYGTPADQVMEKEIIEQIGPTAIRNRYIERPQFLKLCAWKTQRSKKHCVKNDAAFVKEVTSVALTAVHEALRIEVLTLLDGVGWPTASVILHFCSPDRYPILDFRALWSLGSEEPASGYNFDFWWEYVLTCRRLADEAGVSMRQLDRALWGYSDIHQSPVIVVSKT